MSAQSLSSLEQSIVDGVAKHGCFIMSVFDPKKKEPDFSYSIGFPETVSHPNVIVFSLPQNLRASMINELWRQLSEDGSQLRDGDEIENLLEGHQCVAREITDIMVIQEHFGSATWYSRHSGNSQKSDLVRAFQIFWPGASQGLLPWETGCAQAVIDDQPPLYSQSLN